MSAFDKIKLGLEEAIAYEQGTLDAKTTKMIVEPVARYEASEIKAIRKSTGFTQAVFAQYMGVSVKTVEAWEAGRNHPEGAACRLLALTKADTLFPQKAGIISQ
ncbi:MAG: helix-turn-helix domain-containing protein [Firmicutes bacterium]|nr:helix-turn-helix domain-containing protein [Bacillota bacterium]